MSKTKWVALLGLVLGAVATALSASPYGSAPAVHTACDVVLKVLVGLGLTMPVSLMGSPAQPSLSETAAQKAQNDR